MGTAAEVEMLFSLELLVECVNVGPGTHLESGPLLAVAFRLLDFPTLLVRQTELENLRRGREREREGPERLPGGTDVPFDKGKSCLFKMGLSALHRHLTTTPLYAMLLDVSPRVPKLVGSCLISMAGAVEKIRLDVEERGIATPSVQGKRGLYPLYNLMGVKIGHISAGYRLMSLGVGLLPHIPENEVLRAKMRDTDFPHLPSEERRVPERGESRKVADQGTGHILSDSEKCPDHVPGDQAVQPNQFDQSEEPVIISVLKGKRNPEKLAKEAPMKHKMRQQVLESEPTVDIKVDNVFCPPPMYYSQSKDGPKEKISEIWKTAEPKEESILLEELDSNESDELFDMSQSLSDFRLPESRSEAAATLKTQVQTSPAIPDAGNTIRQFPLLNALLLELSLLHHDQLPRRIPLAVHPQLAWLYSGLKNESPEFHKTTKSTSQRPKFANPDFKQRKEVQKQPVSPRVFDKENNPKLLNAKKGSEHSKRKLMYGLTNTLRLRLRQKNPDMLILHEKKELSRKRELEQLKEKKTVRKRPEGKRERSSSILQKDQQFSGGRFKENIETLIQSSIEPDATHSSKVLRNGKLMNKSNFEATLTRECATRAGGMPVQPPGPLNCRVEISDLQRANDRGLYRKDIKIRLPEIFSHDSDHSVNENCNKAVDLLQTPYMNPGLASDPTIVEDINARISYSSCDEPKYSEDFTSPEPTGNSGDFTSPEPTSRLADTLGSSTEAATIRVKHKYSNNELDSSLSKYSSDNQGTAQSETEDDSVPLPAPFKQSPIQSVKSIILVRSRQQNMTLSSITSNLSDGATSSTGENQLKKILNLSTKQETEKQLKSTVQWGSRSDINPASTEVPQLSSSRNGHRSLEESQSLGTSQVSSYAPSSVSDLVCGGLEMNTKDIQRDEINELGRAGIINECRHISELVANKLPGYTL
ncbi:microtubule-associated protein 10 [Pristis pectinata]|uniref:microtubule-associated protein 10 n=1 Tax=Pristis pectinata TaxID=685728 RepID=UPI00223E7E2A|nr:microtubule-associated protein 10 [Pristis pectinata]